MDKAKVTDKMIDQIFVYVCEKELESMLNELPAEAELEKYAPSPEFDRKMLKLLRAEDKKRRKKPINMRTRKVFSVLLAAIVIIGLIVSSVDAIKIRFTNTIIDIRNNFFSMDFNDTSQYYDSNQIPDDWINIYIPEYLPEGFYLDEAIKESNIYHLIFINHIGEQVMITQNSMSSGLKTQIDNENVIHEKVNIDGIEYSILSKINDDVTERKVYWQKDDYYFTIDSALEKEVVIDIAASLKEK